LFIADTAVWEKYSNGRWCAFPTKHFQLPVITQDDRAFNSSTVLISLVSYTVSRISIFWTVGGFFRLTLPSDKSCQGCCGPRMQAPCNLFCGHTVDGLDSVFLVSYWHILEPIYRNSGRNECALRVLSKVDNYGQKAKSA
jgi:hypothetical protein